MNVARRELLRFVTSALAGAGASAGCLWRSWAEDTHGRAPFNVRSFGAVADGNAVDTPAVNRAIAAAAAAGGGTVQFPAGTCACHSIRLRSFVTLYVEPGAIILAAPAFGYDTAEPNGAFERYQDFGHNHWHNSLIWGEDLRDVAIVGLGLICGRGLSWGEAAEPGLPPADAPGAADKAIALKRCRNVTVRGIAILAAGHFGILATGVENLTLEPLRNRRGSTLSQASLARCQRGDCSCVMPRTLRTYSQPMPRWRLPWGDVRRPELAVEPQQVVPGQTEATLSRKRSGAARRCSGPSRMCASFALK